MVWEKELRDSGRVTELRRFTSLKRQLMDWVSTFFWRLFTGVAVYRIRELLPTVLVRIWVNTDISEGRMQVPEGITM